jgi:radical SAM protein
MGANFMTVGQHVVGGREGASPDLRPDVHGIRPIGSVRPVEWVYDRAPMTVYWEMTLACALTCRHCRAQAWNRPAPGQLTTEQGVALLDDIASFGDPLPHLIMTGGDPMRRPDLLELMEEARTRRIGVSLSPAVTPELTRERLAEVQRAGTRAISLSLDGSTPQSHDGLRRVPGTFDLTMRALDDAAALGLPVQVNTLVTSSTAPDLPALHRLLVERAVARWTLFFLIRTGRGAMLQEVAPEQSEQILRWLDGVRDESPFQVSTTEALHFRRITSQSMEARGMTRAQIGASRLARSYGVRDGNGIIFISHVGDVTPSGFLPVTIGNVTRDSLVRLYREDPLMRALRSPDSFGGDCGVCEYNRWCGGSRSRAYAATGDPLAADPLCVYRPGRSRSEAA